METSFQLNASEVTMKMHQLNCKRQHLVAMEFQRKNEIFQIPQRDEKNRLKTTNSMEPRWEERKNATRTQEQDKGRCVPITSIIHSLNPEKCLIFVFVFLHSFLVPHAHGHNGGPKSGRIERIFDTQIKTRPDHHCQRASGVGESEMRRCFCFVQN